MASLTSWIDDFGQDVRFAARSLAHNKAYAIAAILTLTLGIGANTALFSVVNGVVLRPLPFPHPDRLVQLFGSSPLTPSRDTVNDLPDIRQQSTSFDGLVGYEVGAQYLRTRAGTERVMVVRAEKPFFSMLGVAPMAGRTFAPDDGADVAIIGEAFWQEQFDGDPAIVGRAITLDDQSFTIVGVMPDAFQFPYAAASLLPGVAPATRTQLWVPFNTPLPPRVRFGSVTGRLKPGVSMSQASNELALIARRLEQDHPDTHRDRGLYLEPLSDVVVGSAVRRPLFVLFGAVAVVLILACANVINLMLVRMTLRSREVALRSAIGAGAVRLARQFLAESLFLVVLGGGLGLLVGALTTRALADLVRTAMPRAHEIELDWRVFLFLLAVCGATAVMLGLIPALMAMRAGTQSALQDLGGRATVSRWQRRVRGGIVVAEIALALVLAVGAAMLVRELVRLRQTASGMVTTNVITFHVGHRMNPTSDVQRFMDIADRVGAMPGVRAAGFTQMLPLQNWGWTSSSNGFTRTGQRPPTTPPFTIEMRYVTPGYFEALGIPVRGRPFARSDGKDAPRVILINEALARRSFGDADPIGIATSRGTIVGVVSDVKQISLSREAAPEMYFPMVQNWSQLSELGMSLVVRADSVPDGLDAPDRLDGLDRFIGPIRSVIGDVDPSMAVFAVKAMDRVVSDSLSDFTLFLRLMAAFAGLALVLAVTGTYGVMASVTAARTHEFAIRAALGADRVRVTRLVLGQGLTLTSLGLAAGLAGAVFAAPLLDGLPIAVGRPDLLTTIPVAVFIAIIALAACLIPARRAAAVQPMQLLRNE